MLLDKVLSQDNILFFCLFIIVYYSVIIYFFLLKNKKFLSTDIKPTLIPMSSLKTHGDVTKIIPVKTGIIIEGFPQFSINKNLIVVNCMVWFKFNRSLIDLESIGSFSFLNTVKIYKKDLVKISVMENDFFVQYKVVFECSINVDQKFFPMNDHVIYIVMMNESFSAEEIVFDVNTSSIDFAKDLDIEDWNLIGSNAESGFAFLTIPGVSAVPITHPRVVYTMNIKKTGLRKAALILIPIILILFIASTTLLMPSSTAISTAIGCLTGILAYRFVINTMSPNVGYFTLADHIYNFCLLLIFMTFLLALIGSFHENKYNQLIGEFWFFGTRVAVIFLVIYLLFFWQKTNLKVNKASMDFNNIIASSKEKKLPPLTVNSLKSSLLSWNKNSLWKTVFLKHRSPFLPWKLLLKMMLDYQQTILVHGKKLIIQLPISSPSKCVVLANNESHGFIQLLEKLKDCEIIDNEWNIISPNNYIIFHQNIHESLDDLIIILSTQLILMKKNPKQVFLLQDMAEINKLWKKNIDVFIGNKLQNKYPLEFKKFVVNFFELLPKSIYLESQMNSETWSVQIVSETQEETLSNVGGEIQLFNPVSQKMSNIEAILNVPLKAKIYNTIGSKYFSDKALFYSIPNKGVAIWNVNSSHNDKPGMAIIEINPSEKNGILHWYQKQHAKLNDFESSTYSLAYYYKITSFDKSSYLTKELVFGASMDLVKTMSNRSIKNIQGITLKFVEQNRLGGIQERALKMMLLNDNSTPLDTKKNIEYLIDYKLEQPIIFSTLGTPTTECLAPLVKDKKILLLFPCTGSNLLRTPEYCNLIFFRASFAVEGQVSGVNYNYSRTTTIIPHC